MKFEKTYLDENDVVCDFCNKLARRDECIEIRSPLSTHILHQHKGECRSELLEEHKK